MKSSPDCECRVQGGRLVVPVSFASAWRWARGQITDGELLLGADYFTPSGEAIWIASLFGSHQVRGMVREILRWPAARVCVFRSDAPAVARMSSVFDPVPGFVEEDGRRRFAIFRPGIRMFVDRFFIRRPQD